MTLQRNQIVEAALHLLNEDGLEGVTVRKVATRLNVHVGGLYWHVKNKHDLLDEMANTILASEFGNLANEAPDQPWAVWLPALAQRLRRAMLAFREGGRVVAGARLHRAETLAHLYTYTQERLRTEGLSADEAHWLSVTVVSFTFGFVIEEQAGPTPEKLAQLQSSGPHHPFLRATLAGMEARHLDFDTDFRMGLGYIVRGAQVSHVAAEA